MLYSPAKLCLTAQKLKNRGITKLCGRFSPAVVHCHSLAARQFWGQHWGQLWSPKMSCPQMSLTDIATRSARPTDKLQRPFDGNGLYLEVSPSGGKWRHLKYRIGEKGKRVSIGVYPDVGLRDAREKSWTLRKQISAGINPALARKTIKIMGRSAAQNTFEAVAREWHLKFLPTWNEKHAENILSRLERFVFPIIGKRPIAQIEPPKILHALQRIEAHGTIETAHAHRQHRLRGRPARHRARRQRRQARPARERGTPVALARLGRRRPGRQRHLQGRRAGAHRPAGSPRHPRPQRRHGRRPHHPPRRFLRRQDRR